MSSRWVATVAQARELLRRPASGLTAGLALVAAYNWWRWQHDRDHAQMAANLTSPRLHAEQLPRISVLVAAWNEAAMIERHLQSFLALRLPQIELILCAGGADQTFERAAKYASSAIQILEQHGGEGKQRALARCLGYARGALIYLTDADCLYSDEALEALLATLLAHDEQVVTGGSRPLDQQLGDLVPRYVWAADVWASSHYPPYISGLLGRNTLLRRSALEHSGGLDFAAPTGTDYHLARRLLAAGFKIRFVPQSSVQSVYPPTIGIYWRKQARWMRNLLLYGPGYGAYDQVWAVLKSALVGMVMLLLPAVGALTDRRAGAIWLVLLAHSTLAKVRYAAYCAIVAPSLGAGPATERPGSLLTLRYGLALTPLALVDYLIWITPVLEVCMPQRQHRW